ncbi:MAG: recombination protein O N-terminal domain-containing protein, partial [Patescibacteria group bacterium]
MYQKYQTDALVLASRESGENDRVFVLYTVDFGLVRARASAVRTEKSRMRYALQNYARANAALVRGKRGWRMAGASAVKNACGDRRGIAAFARISELTVRLVHGEEKNDY